MALNELMGPATQGWSPWAAMDQASGLKAVGIIISTNAVKDVHTDEALSGQQRPFLLRSLFQRIQTHPKHTGL